MQASTAKGKVLLVESVIRVRIRRLHNLSWEVSVHLKKFHMLTQMISPSGSCGSVCDASVRGSLNCSDSPADNVFVPFGECSNPQHITDESASAPIVLAGEEEASGKKPIVVKWEAIVARFQARFQNNFMTSKKVKTRQLR